MPRFKVKAGQHIQGGKTYNKGEIVESDNDLVAMFAEKFELVSESASSPRAQDPVLVRQQPSKAADKDVEEDEDEDETEETPKSKSTPTAARTSHRTGRR